MADPIAKAFAEEERAYEAEITRAASRPDGSIVGLDSGVAIRVRARDVVVDDLEAKTIALRDAAIAYKKAQAEYQDALQAFNRFVAPEPTL